MANLEEYYQRLALPPVPPTSFRKTSHLPCKETQDEKHLREIIHQVDSPELQRKLTAALDSIVACWKTKHDSLVDAFDQSETSKKKLKQHLTVQLQKHEKSIKEAQLYKARFEHLQQQQKVISNTKRGSTLSSNASSISTKSFLSSSSRRSSSSCASSIRQSFFMVDDLIDPILFDSQSLAEASDDDDDDEEDGNIHCTSSNNVFGLHRGLTEHDACTLPISPYTMPPGVSPQTLKTPYNDSKPTTLPVAPLAETTEGSLTYGCIDSFWKTIATGKNHKANVENHIENYFQLGGTPNVAKISGSVNSVKEGYGLIHALIAIKNSKALERVILAGANANVYTLSEKKEHQTTPLVLAAKLGYANGVRLLLRRSNAKIYENRGPYGENALHAAVLSGSLVVVSLLLTESKNALLEMEDDNGATPLHFACTFGNIDMIRLFVKDCQTQPDRKDKKGETPLHYAVRNNKLKAVRTLVGEFGVNPSPYTLKVPTPLELAKRGGLKPVAEYLKGEGAKTTKEIEKASRDNSAAGVIYSSNSSTFSGESSGSGSSSSIGPASAINVRQFLHSKTSQILRGKLDL